MPGCEGRWIDVSTLSRAEWTCSDCRASLNYDPELLEGPSLPPERAELESGWGWKPWLLLAAATGLGTALGLALGLYL